MTNPKWSTPTLKARWFDDVSIEFQEVVVDADGQVSARTATTNVLKSIDGTDAVDLVTVPGLLEPASTSDDPS